MEALTIIGSGTTTCTEFEPKKGLKDRRKPIAYAKREQAWLLLLTCADPLLRKAKPNSDSVDAKRFYTDAERPDATVKPSGREAF